ncbi:MAG: PQQ-binding-like beta-propeller repeat protein [Alphaproteobacteria bacterium]|nr:PQQ-binding-like beta-propeller repeat protein [Alphaproteobacteria bacterium]
MRTGIFGVAILVAAAPALAAPADQEWRTYGHDYGETRHSPLSQITPANVARLKPVWTFHMRPADVTGKFAASENTPIVVDGVMFVSTPYGRVLALDAETGKERWAYHVPGGDQPATRGVAWWPGGGGLAPRIVFGTRAGLMIALDAKTGAPASGFGADGVIDLKSPRVMQGFEHAYFGVTSAPVIYRNLVITGSRTQEIPAKGASGQVRAFDVRTGREVWHFNGVPQPGEKFHGTWDGDSWEKRSGVNVWVGLSLDAKRGIAYLPFGAPTFDQYGGDRKGPSLFSNSLVAVDAATGKYLWHFQAVHQDLWDYDLPLTTLVDVKKGGRTIPAIAVMSKASLLFLLDRVTGKPIFDIREVPVPTDTDLVGESPSSTQPMSVTPPLGRTSFKMSELANLAPQQTEGCNRIIRDMNIVDGSFFQPQRADSGVARFPGSWGGVDWSHASFDPATGYYIVNSTDMASPQVMKREADGTYNLRDGYQWFWDKVSHMPCQVPPWGSLYAVNVNTGQVVWRHNLGVTDGLANPDTGRPNMGGPITTAGGLIFIGSTDDRRLRAFDTKTGKELWSVKVPASLYGTPLTWRGKSGRQYVGGVFTGGFWGDPAGADDVIAFALPEEK